MPCKGLDCEKKEMTNILLDRKSAATAGLEYHKINFFFFFENKIDRKTYQFKLCNQVTASKIWFKIFLFITTILEDPHHKIPLHLTANKHQLSVVMLSFLPYFIIWLLYSSTKFCSVTQYRSVGFLNCFFVYILKP